MNSLRQAIAGMQVTRKMIVSDLITYQRGSAKVSIYATIGKTDALIDTGLSVRIENNQVDWIIAATDLVIGGDAVTPIRGDVITGPDGTVYEVQAPDGQTQPYNQDPTGTQLRIHTKVLSA